MTESQAKPNPRANMIRRIKALLSKTIENGATEAEAMSALAKAQEMMNAYGLTQDALEAEAFVKAHYEGRAHRNAKWGRELSWGVGQFTGAFAWFPKDKPHGVVAFAGRESDAIFAEWLIDALDGFVNRAALTFIASTGGARVTNARRARRVRGQDGLFDDMWLPAQYGPRENSADADKVRSFCIGVCARISQRLMEMSDEDAKQRQKFAMARLEREGMTFHDVKRDKRNLDANAFNAGMRAGESATFNKPMGGGGSRGGSQPLAVGAR